MILLPIFSLAGVLSLTVILSLRRQTLRPTLAVVAVSIVMIMGLWSQLAPSQIPIAWVTLLHEGSGLTNIFRTFGAHFHTGPIFYDIIGLLDGHEPYDIRNVVRINLLFWALTSAVAWGVFYRITGSILLGLAWAALLALNPGSVNAALSGTSAPIFGLLTFAAVIPCVALTPERGVCNFVNIAAITTAILLTATATAIRVDHGLPGLLLLAAMAARLQWGDAQLNARTAEIASTAWRYLLSAATRKRFVLAVVCIVCVVHITRLFGNFKLGTFIWLLIPIGPEPLSALLSLLHVLPMGVVILGVIGSTYISIRRPWASGLAGFSLLLLLRAYVSASNNVELELFRYLAMLLPLFLLCAAFGWQAIELQIARTSQPSAFRGLAKAVLAVLVFCPPPSGMQEYLVPDGRDQPVKDSLPMLLSTLQQQEARLILEGMKQWPTCSFITPVTTSKAGMDRGHGDWSWLMWSQDVRQPILMPRDKRSAGEVIAASLPSDCYHIFIGQDCNLVDNPSACDAERTGTRELVRMVHHGQYNNPPERGLNLGDAEIGFWSVPSL